MERDEAAYPYTMYTTAMVKIPRKIGTDFWVQNILGIGIEAALDLGPELRDTFMAWMRRQISGGRS